jgi:hypothetical protein
VVVDAYDAIERSDQLPVERRSQSLLFLLERLKRGADLQVAAVSRCDDDSEFIDLKSAFVAEPVNDVLDVEVILDVSLQKIEAIQRDGLAHRLPDKESGVSARFLPMGGSCDVEANEGRAEIVEQLRFELVGIGGDNAVKLRKTLS